MKTRLYDTYLLTCLIYPLLFAKEYWTSTKCHIHNKLKYNISVSYKVCKELWFYINTYFWSDELLLENGQLYLLKGENLVFMRDSYVSTPRLRKVLSIRVVNFSFINSVAPIPHSFKFHFKSKTLENVLISNLTWIHMHGDYQNQTTFGGLSFTYNSNP